MGQWTGIIKCGDLEMKATVLYQIDSRTGFKKWRGSGTSQQHWPLGGPYDTNIGTISINQLNINSSGTLIIFDGNSDPAGPLAEAMGL